MSTVVDIRVYTFLRFVTSCTWKPCNNVSGIAINKDGIVYFADGANIRTIDSSDVVTTLIGEQGHPTQWSPLPCDRVVSTQEVSYIFTTQNHLSSLTTSKMQRYLIPIHNNS